MLAAAILGNCSFILEGLLKCARSLSNGIPEALYLSSFLAMYGFPFAVICYLSYEDYLFELSYVFAFNCCKLTIVMLNAHMAGKEFKPYRFINVIQMFLLSGTIFLTLANSPMLGLAI